MSAAADAEAEEVEAFDRMGPDGGTLIGLVGGDFNITELEIAGVAQEETESRQGAKHVGLGIRCWSFGWIDSGPCGGAAAEVRKIHVADLDVFDEGSRELR